MLGKPRLDLGYPSHTFTSYCGSASMRRRLLFEELGERIVPAFQGNQLFPLDNPWNQVVAGAPVAVNSNAIISAFIPRHNGNVPNIHADFNDKGDGQLYG